MSNNANDTDDSENTGAWRIKVARDLADAKDRGLKLEATAQKLQSQHVELRKAVADNTAITMSNTNQIEKVSDNLTGLAKSLSGIIRVSNSIDGTVDIGARLGGFMKWLITIATFITIMWAVVRYVIIEVAKR